MVLICQVQIVTDFLGNVVFVVVDVVVAYVVVVLSTRQEKGFFSMF